MCLTHSYDLLINSCFCIVAIAGAAWSLYFSIQFELDGKNVKTELELRHVYQDCVLDSPIWEPVQCAFLDTKRLELARFRNVAIDSPNLRLILE